LNTVAAVDAILIEMIQVSDPLNAYGSRTTCGLR
jgi:hypothetical protein